MTSVLFLGLIIGMQHALEADHVAAVASIAAKETTVRRIVAHGSVWGLGHMVTLTVFAGGAVLFGTTLSADLALGLEAAVGIMLVALGSHLLASLWKGRIHFHLHRHTDKTVHFHAHSHRGENGDHTASAHHHDHPRGLPVRTFIVGMVHGMAGSAAILILTATSIGDPAIALASIALFALGSICGMVALSALIAIPLAYTARSLTLGHWALKGAIGCATVGLGVSLLVRLTVA